METADSAAAIRSDSVENITILANSRLFRAALANYIIDMLCGIICIVLAPQFYYIMLVPMLLLTVTYCCITERWCLLLTFKENCLLYKPLFRKGRQISYANYPCIRYAYYMHGNLLAAYKVDYFVLTNRRLSDDELSHINLVAPNEDLIKIRYSHKTYLKLISVLPKSIAVQIENIYITYIKG